MKVLKLIALSFDFLSRVFTFQFLPKNINNIKPIGGKIIKINIQDKVFSGLFLPNKIIIKITNRLIINEIKKISLNASI